MSLDKLKLSKRLHRNMLDLGYTLPTAFQLRSLSRIIGGHSLIGIAPEGSGKTTSYVLGVLMRLKYTDDEAPKVLVLAPNEEKITEIVDRFLTISQNKSLHIMGLKTSGGMEEEIDELVLGVDIVVATPARARAVYLKLGLNLNRIQTFIIDDAEEIVKQGMQTNVRELAQSCGKVQYLAFSTVEHEKLHLMIDDFMPYATLIEVDELIEKSTETNELMLYQVPNFTTKINLLNSLLEDKEVFDKVVIFVNNISTAQKIAESLHVRKGEISFASNLANNIHFVTNEEKVDISQFPFIFHFEIPNNINDFLQNVIKSSDEEAIAITFATDLELPAIKKIEHELGKRIPIMPLPDDLIIYRPSAPKEKSEVDETRGGAFHKKKESNSKTYNIGGGAKAKLTKKNNRK